MENSLLKENASVKERIYDIQTILVHEQELLLEVKDALKRS